MIKNKEKDYCNQIYYQSFNSHHEFLSASLCISLLCILISILLFSHISTQEDKSSFFCKEPNILVSFAQYITDTFNPAMGILGSLIVSALIFMSKGSNKYLFLQWRTIYNAVPWKIWLYCIQFIVSFIFQVHASKYEQYIIAACSAFSILMLIFCFIWYVIRYNNERQYFVNEQCLVLLKTFSKPSKFKNYLSLLFPNSPEKYNDMDDNINILKSLILHTDISLNLESSQNQTYCFFKHLVIPYIVFMKKTFLADKEKLIISLQKALSYDLNSNPDVNQALRYLLLLCKSL